MDTVDVLVVGAGPAGCMVAGELALAGRSVVVLDKHDAPSPLSRAFGVHARTMEVLDTRGLADELRATGTTTPGLALWEGSEVDLTTLPSPFPFLLVTPQLNVDTLLEKNATSRGAQVVRGATATKMWHHDDGVVVRATTADGEREWKAAYVVGADGSRSTVRDLVGLPFPGDVLLKSIVLADAHLTEPPDSVVTVDAGEDCFAFLAPFGDGWFRVIVWDRRYEDDDAFQPSEGVVRDVLRRAMGTDYGLGEIRWLTRFQSDERQVESYRAGRVFLAGDAAHVHSPAGGQGMNTGIQDAFNLGWKLAAVLGGADPAVLDTYHGERHPVGKLVLRSSGATIRVMTARSRPARFLRRHVLPSLLSRENVARKASGMFSGIGIRYGRHRGDHKLVGTRAPDVPLREGRLFEALRCGGFVLVLETGAAAVDSPVRVERRTDGGPALLVRPDGYVAWAGSTATDGWRTALGRWTR
jgi:2-polyprenyl-6-methoxyphenol hydroxylase-like FAD-dependent oxidoreductase